MNHTGNIVQSFQILLQSVENALLSCNSFSLLAKWKKIYIIWYIYVIEYATMFPRSNTGRKPFQARTAAGSPFAKTRFCAYMHSEKLWAMQSCRQHGHPTIHEAEYVQNVSVHYLNIPLIGKTTFEDACTPDAQNVVSSYVLLNTCRKPSLVMCLP